MSASTYITLEEFKFALNITDSVEDVALSGVLSSAARAVDAYCDRYFGQQGTAGVPQTRIFHPVGRLVEIDDLVTLTDVETDGTGNADTFTSIGATAVLTLPVNAAQQSPARPYTALQAKTTASLPAEYGWVRVSGVWGWPEVPQQIKDATKLQAIRLYKSKDVPLGALGGADMMGILRLQSSLHPDARLLCDPFVRTNI